MLRHHRDHILMKTMLRYTMQNLKLPWKRTNFFNLPSIYDKHYEFMLCKDRRASFIYTTWKHAFFVCV